MPRKLTNLEKVLKALPASIHIAEAATVKGPKKKALAIANASKDLPLKPREKQAAGLVNDALVAAFNLAGIFAKKAPAK